MEGYQITQWCHHFLKSQVRAGDVCVDATAGKGSDTLVLCGLAGPEGKVYAFDVQATALEQTRLRLEEQGVSAILIHDSHERMETYVKEAGEVSCIVFNLGYLPGGDHRVATRGETSIRAMEAGLRLLRKGGMMNICIYRGGDSGYEEYEAVTDWLKKLDHKKYLVIKSEYYNRPNDPPVPALVIRL